MRSSSHYQPECSVAGTDHQLPSTLWSASEPVQPLLPMCWVRFWDCHTLPLPSLCPSHAVRPAEGRVVRLTLPYRWHSPSLRQAVHRDAGGSCSRICAEGTVPPHSHWHHYFQRWVGWHECIAQREPGMVRGRGRAQQSQGSLSNMTDGQTQREERQTERGQVGLREREPQDRRGHLHLW